MIRIDFKDMELIQAELWFIEENNTYTLRLETDSEDITLERLSGVQVDLIRDGIRAAQHKELRKKGRE